MPYIKQDRRDWLDDIANDIGDFFGNDDSASVGDLNYLITKILLATDPQNYSDFNALVGMLECCKLEFYRRAVAAYEQQKINENGDVY